MGTAAKVTATIVAGHGLIDCLDVEYGELTDVGNAKTRECQRFLAVTRKTVGSVV